MFPAVLAPFPASAPEFTEAPGTLHAEVRPAPPHLSSGDRATGRRDTLPPGATRRSPELGLGLPGFQYPRQALPPAVPAPPPQAPPPRPRPRPRPSRGFPRSPSAGVSPSTPQTLPVSPPLSEAPPRMSPALKLPMAGHRPHLVVATPPPAQALLLAPLFPRTLCLSRGHSGLCPQPQAGPQSSILASGLLPLSSPPGIHTDRSVPLASLAVPPGTPSSRPQCSPHPATTPHHSQTPGFCLLDLSAVFPCPPAHPHRCPFRGYPGEPLTWCTTKTWWGGGEGAGGRCPAISPFLSSPVCPSRLAHQT